MMGFETDPLPLRKLRPPQILTFHRPPFTGKSVETKEAREILKI